MNPNGNPQEYKAWKHTRLRDKNEFTAAMIKMATNTTNGCYEYCDMTMSQSHAVAMGKSAYYPDNHKDFEFESLPTPELWQELKV